MGEREDGCAEAVLGWIREATWCQQLPICRCVPVKASAWQQACDLAPSITPRREARPGVTDPLTGCFPFAIVHSLLRFSFFFRLCTMSHSSYLQPLFAAAILCPVVLYSYFIVKEDRQLGHKSCCCHDWRFGGLSVTSCERIMPAMFISFSFNIKTNLSHWFKRKNKLKPLLFQP